ncbi:MAG TPA: CpsB/CapC family capsule biosynthesis tyrosine phosphatase, partial [Tepidisphaeraceae bacterium]|nr:CpsB/CapC family capsule biosynthesis tyrosine phosphatase [Tepidisphaeraceae bacterium]
NCDFPDKIWEIMGRIDVHSHLLPGVDDGCKDLQESIACARMLVGAGYSHCFCTPHIWPSDLKLTVQTVRQLTHDLQSALDGVGIPLQVVPGSELNLNQYVMREPADRIISAALAGKYILVDMWADRLPEWFEPTIRWLQEMQLKVILAHPERMRAVQDEPGIVYRFEELGILLQGNLQCFADRPDADTRRVAELYASEDRYFLLGSDTHDSAGLRKRLVGLVNVIELVGDERVDKLTRENPKLMLVDGEDREDRG